MKLFDEYELIECNECNNTCVSFMFDMGDCHVPLFLCKNCYTKLLEKESKEK